MISPADIHNKVFKKGFRGYDEEEVDDFLDQIINDYEALFRENNQLKEELKLSEKKLDQFRDMEKNIRDTLLVAQKTADDVMGNAKARSEEMRVAAEKECANMKKQAEIEVRQKLENIEDQVRHKEDQYDNMLHRQRQFLIKIKALLRTELELLEEEGVQQTVGALGPDDPDEAEDMAAAEAEALRELAPDKAKEKESKAVPKVEGRRRCAARMASSSVTRACSLRSGARRRSRAIRNDICRFEHSSHHHRPDCKARRLIAHAAWLVRPRDRGHISFHVREEQGRGVWAV